VSKPAPYPLTDASEQDSLTTLKSLIDSHYVKDDIRTRDKVPNWDGTIEILDQNLLPLGKLDVQLRSLPPGTKSYSCQASLVGYSKVSTLPLILICVDSELKRAFWRQISPTMPEYKENQKSFTIHFSDDADSIDSRGIYLQKWTALAQDYQDRISEFCNWPQKLDHVLR